MHDIKSGQKNLNFSQLKKNLKKDASAFKKIRVALLGDSATQFLAQAIVGFGFEYRIDIQLFEAEFNQIDRQILDPDSELYAFKPEVVIIFESSNKLLGAYNKAKPENRGVFANNKLESIAERYETIQSRMNSKIIYCNYTEIDDSVYGNFANHVGDSFLFQVRKLNYELMAFASQNKGFYICDLSSVQQRLGREVFFQPAMYVNNDMTISIDALPLVAGRILDSVVAMNGMVKKCLILDLDNTLWGGIIGDDGIENIELGSLGIGKAFTDFQYWIKKLKERGIILAICSKNTEHVAKEPFEKHPDMVLRLEDIAVFVANWENKADNIGQIQEILNIGFDSMVFIDDNPFERNLVRENIPGICVPEMPEDPAAYLEFLYSLNLFETTTLSEEDSERTKLYQIEAQRMVVKKTFVNEADFLKSLSMTSRIEHFTAYNIPRVAQLSLRSNQFNLRTIRYSESDIERMSKSNTTFPFTFCLEDKFGDHGLICVVILKKENDESLFIDTWFMSCRVLKRGMEEFVLNTLVSFAKEKKITSLIGEYIPTSKNEMVKDHYLSLGFKENNHLWELKIDQYINKECHIQKT